MTTEQIVFRSCLALLAVAMLFALSGAMIAMV